MKKLLVLMLVLAMAGMANARLTIDVSGGDANIVIKDDGTTSPQPNDEMGAYFLGIETDGSGALSVTNANIVYPGNSVEKDIWDDTDTAELLNSNNYFAYLFLSDVEKPGTALDDLVGVVVNTIQVTGRTAGVWLRLYYDDIGLDNASNPYARVWLPEPMTIALLGLGGLFLRRRK